MDTWQVDQSAEHPNQSKLWIPMGAATFATNAASKGHKRTQIVLQESFLLEVATWDAWEICCTNSHWAILTQIPMLLVFLRAHKNMSNEHVKSTVSDGTLQILQLREFNMPQPWAVDVQSLGLIMRWHPTAYFRGSSRWCLHSLPLHCKLQRRLPRIGCSHSSLASRAIVWAKQWRNLERFQDESDAAWCLRRLAGGRQLDIVSLHLYH